MNGHAEWWLSGVGPTPRITPVDCVHHENHDGSATESESQLACNRDLLGLHHSAGLTLRPDLVGAITRYSSSKIKSGQKAYFGKGHTRNQRMWLLVENWHEEWHDQSNEFRPALRLGPDIELQIWAVNPTASSSKVTEVI